MTPRIHQLPDDLIARIAAGEVIERPASVIKELVENSLDAGARSITIGIEGAGRTSLLIVDNGSGMTLEEAHLSLRRHATSKITQLDDLETIGTYGFRGEALPSIASVSRMRLVTRHASDDTGWELLLEGGRLVSEKPTAREPGTTIEIRDLFFNTPARFKFLKSDGTERSQCLRVVEEIAFAAPHVHFEVVSEKGTPMVFPPGAGDRANALRARVAEAWGSRWATASRLVDKATDHFSVTGWVTDQEFHQATARHQFLFVNRRPVQNRRLTRAVYDAYLGQLPSLRHPGWVLFLDVDPSTVDVNVHPAKREVKLAHESEVFGFLLAAVREALQPQGARPSPAVAFPDAQPSLASGFISEWAPRNQGRAPASFREGVDLLYRPTENSSGPAISTAPFDPRWADLTDPSLRVVGQVRSTYIVAQTPTTLLLIDQHAAAEKIAYERLMRERKEGAPSRQMLLVPFTWEVAVAVAPLVESRLDVFQSLGFDVQPFGRGTFLVKSYPGVLGENVDLHSLLDSVTDVLGEPTGDRGAQENSFEHRLAAMAACKSSVKAGDTLDLPECERLVRDLPSCEAPFTCPHGRPTITRFPFDDIDRRFRR